MGTLTHDVSDIRSPASAYLINADNELEKSIAYDGVRGTRAAMASLLAFRSVIVRELLLKDSLVISDTFASGSPRVVDLLLGSSASLPESFGIQDLVSSGGLLLARREGAGWSDIADLFRIRNTIYSTNPELVPLATRTLEQMTTHVVDWKESWAADSFRDALRAVLLQNKTRQSQLMLEDVESGFVASFGPGDNLTRRKTYDYLRSRLAEGVIGDQSWHALKLSVDIAYHYGFSLIVLKTPPVAPEIIGKPARSVILTAFRGMDPSVVGTAEATLRCPWLGKSALLALKTEALLRLREDKTFRENMMRLRNPEKYAKQSETTADVVWNTTARHLSYLGEVLPDYLDSSLLPAKWQEPYRRWHSLARQSKSLRIKRGLYDYLFVAPISILIHVSLKVPGLTYLLDRLFSRSGDALLGAERDRLALEESRLSLELAQLVASEGEFSFEINDDE